MRLSLIILLIHITVIAQENIAVMDLQGNGIETTDLRGLSNRLRSELFNTGVFSVIERSRMDDILKEQGFQQSGCAQTECAVEVGQLIGVRHIVVGTVDRIAGVYSVSVRIVNVQTGKIKQMVTGDCAGCGLDKVLLETIPGVAYKIAGQSRKEMNPGQSLPPAKAPAPKKCVTRERVFFTTFELNGKRLSFDEARDLFTSCPESAIHWNRYVAGSVTKNIFLFSALTYIPYGVIIHIFRNSRADKMVFSYNYDCHCGRQAAYNLRQTPDVQ